MQEARDSKLERVTSAAAARQKTQKDDPKPTLPVENLRADAEQASRSLRPEFQFTEDELVNFAEENALSTKSRKSIWSFVQYRLISKLVEERVPIQDLARVALFRLFRSRASPHATRPEVKVVQVSDFEDLLFELEGVMAPFEEIHQLVQADILRMRDFDSDKNMSDDQFFFASFIRAVQK